MNIFRATNEADTLTGITMSQVEAAPIITASSSPGGAAALKRKADAPASAGPGTGQATKQKSMTGGLQAKTVRAAAAHLPLTTPPARAHPTHL